MTDRYGRPVEIQTSGPAPFVEIEGDLVDAFLEVLRREGATGIAGSSAALVDAFDPTDPGVVLVEIAPGADLDRLQDRIDSLTVTEGRRIVPAEEP